MSDMLSLVRLPEPWKTTYDLKVVSTEHQLRRLQLCRSPRSDDGISPPEPLYHGSMTFTDLLEPGASTTPEEGNNSAWARAQRAPLS